MRWNPTSDFYSTYKQSRVDKKPTRNLPNEDKSGGPKGWTASPGDNWKLGILQRAGWGWLCSALSVLSGSCMSDSLPLWWTVHLGSGWWQNGDTCHDPLRGKKNTKQRWIRNREAATKRQNHNQQTLLCLTCRTGCIRWLYQWDGWENCPNLCLSADLLCPWSKEPDTTNYADFQANCT